MRQIEGYDNVAVAVNSGVVTLTGDVLENAAADELDALVARVEGVVTINNDVLQTDILADRLSPALDRLLARFDQTISYLPLLVVAMMAFGVLALVGMLLARLRQPFDRLAPNRFIADIYRQVVRIVFVIAGIVVALDILGATALLGTILGAAGIIGLAVGFAVRDTVENFIASIMLSVRQPFRPNDFVEIDGAEGFVLRLTSRATILLSRDGNHIRIPNATVFKTRIVNYTRHPLRRFEFDLGVDAEADLALALETGLVAIENLDFVLRDPIAQAWIAKVGDSNVVLQFSGWIDQVETEFLLARGEAIRMTKTALEEAGFGLPEPIYRLRFDPSGIPAPGMPVQTGEQGTMLTKQKTSGAETRPASDAPKDETLERRVHEERQSAGSSDLLSESAPEE